MKRVDFESKLRELKNARGPRARMLVQDLAPAAPRMDAALRDEFQRALKQLGFPSHLIPSAPLLVGETWLLLCESAQRGWAVRLRLAHDIPATVENRLVAELRRAERGLLSSAARECRRLDHPAPSSLDIDAPFGHFEIEGSSLGLSIAVAMLSEATKCAAAPAVAGSAQVDDRGDLRPVEHLKAKLDALHKSWPEVTRVVVATRQKLPDGYAAPVELVRCENLTKAVLEFGLTFDQLPPARLDDFRVRVAQFRSDNGRAVGTAEWARLSAAAWEAAAALKADEPEDSLRAALFAALFAVHSGDPQAARALLSGVQAEATKEFPELYVRHLITTASNQIDSDEFKEAEGSSSLAVKLCNEDQSRNFRRDLLGQALGTQGRVLMHAGHLDRAEPLLRQALDHHEREAPREAPRSACYLATCLRLAGRVDEALLVVSKALVDLQSCAKNWNDEVTTGLYLHLERGRIYASLQRWEAAVADFARVREGQLEDMSYPRLAALRGLATACRHTGQTESANDALSACLKVAHTAVPTLRKVAAIAAGEALLTDPRVAARDAELTAAWGAAFGGEPTRDAIIDQVHRWIY